MPKNEDLSEMFNYFVFVVYLNTNIVRENFQFQFIYPTHIALVDIIYWQTFSYL